MSVMMEGLDVVFANMDRLSDRVFAACEQAVVAGAEVLAAEARERAPKGGATLAGKNDSSLVDSIQVGDPQSIGAYTSVNWGAYAKQAASLDTGSGIHITPSSPPTSAGGQPYVLIPAGRSVKMPNGRVVVLKKDKMHSGVKPTYFMQDAVEVGEKMAISAMVETLKQALA